MFPLNLWPPLLIARSIRFAPFPTPYPICGRRFWPFGLLLTAVAGIDPATPPRRTHARKDILAGSHGTVDSENCVEGVKPQQAVWRAVRSERVRITRPEM